MNRRDFLKIAGRGAAATALTRIPRRLAQSVGSCRKFPRSSLTEGTFRLLKRCYLRAKFPVLACFTFLVMGGAQSSAGVLAGVCFRQSWLARPTQRFKLS
jgi:hypothetical protein